LRLGGVHMWLILPMRDTDALLKGKPVILVTNHASAEDVARGAAAGADEYISKHDMDEKRLVEAVKRWT
jgi:DNA-binding NarL/FixJ family response regulator